jgi:chemotaxis protein CheZ
MGDENNIDKEVLLEKAKALVTALEQGDATEEVIATSLDDIMTLRETSLFHELGKMTRDIHDSIMNFRMDSRISDLTSTDIPDAKDRLEYVIEMTEKSANTVLGVVEKSTPVAEKLIDQSKQLTEQWDKFRRREMDGDELRSMGQDVETFLSETESMMTELLSGFTEVMMAQGFQDLTGQIIRKVITLVDEIEGNLVELIRIQGESIAPDNKVAKENDKDKDKDKDELAGPQILGKESSDDVMQGQDDVDDLLASLGF